MTVKQKRAKTNANAFFFTLTQFFPFDDVDEFGDDDTGALLFFEHASETRASTEYASCAVRMSKHAAIRRAAELNASRNPDSPEIVVAGIDVNDGTLIFLDARNSNGGPVVH